jgi:hypothetical protein
MELDEIDGSRDLKRLESDGSRDLKARVRLLNRKIESEGLRGLMNRVRRLRRFGKSNPNACETCRLESDGL